jgi:hypothetical protein
MSFLHILDSMADFLATALLNLYFLCEESLIILYPHVINHANPALIIFLDLVFELFDSLGMDLLLLLQLDEDFGFFLCMVFL